MVSRKKCIKSSPLHIIERWLYFLVTVATILYICYCVYRDSITYDGILNMFDFGPGWWWLGREQDISNFEWYFWYNIFWTIAPWYLAHFATSKLLEWNCIKYRKAGFLCISAVCLCRVLGWRPLCLLAGHSTVLYLSSMVHVTHIVWLVSLALLSTLNFNLFVTFMKALLEDDEEERWYYILMFTLAFSNIRGTSFCLEKCWNKTRQPSQAGRRHDDAMYQQKVSGAGPADISSAKHSARITSPIDEPCMFGHSYTDMMCYVFYIPLFFTGPILTYDLFQAQINAPLPSSRMSRFISPGLQILRFTFWAMFNEFILHYLYFNAIQHNIDVLGKVSLFTLAGLGYCHGQFFMIKYLVMFGLPASFARLDNLDPPAGPKCISYIYSYTDMWKYFDRGLYSFLKRYIYAPCGGSKEGFHRQIIASLLCFMYIFYWHGAEYYILLWILLNYFGVSMEKIASVMANTALVKHVENTYLSAAMVQRCHAFFNIPIFLLSCFSMFCFFGGHIVVKVFFQRLILEGWLGSWTVLAVLVYCAIQNGIEVNRWMERRPGNCKQS